MFDDLAAAFQQGKLRLDPEFSVLCDPLRRDEREQLEENVLREGVRDPLVAWSRGGVLLDGHNRAAICQKHGLKCAVEFIDLKSRDEAFEWICLNQIGRRNCTPVQSAYLRGQAQLRAQKKRPGRKIIGIERKSYAESHEAAEAAEEEALSASAPAPASTPAAHEAKTSHDLAQRFGVSHSTVEKDAVYAKSVDRLAESDPDLRRKILSGEVRISRRDVPLLADLSDEQIGQLSGEDAKTIEQLAAKLRRARSKAREQEKLRRLAEAGPAASGSTAAPPPKTASGKRRVKKPSAKARFPVVYLDPAPLTDPSVYPVTQVLTSDAVVFVWAHLTQLAKAMGWLETWGLTYRSHLVWDTGKEGSSDWCRTRHHLLLIATRGKFPPPRRHLPSSIISAPSERRRQSQAPEVFFSLIDQLFPDLPKLEPFATKPRGKLWHAGWGEALKESK